MFLSLNLSSIIELGNKSVKRFRSLRSDCNFGQLLSEVDRSAVTGRLDEDQNNVTSAYHNHCFPIALQNNRSRTLRNEWMTISLLSTCRKKNILNRKFIKNPTDFNRQKYPTEINSSLSKQKLSENFICQNSNHIKQYEKNLELTQLLNRLRSEVNTDVFNSIDGKDLTLLHKTVIT